MQLTLTVHFTYTTLAATSMKKAATEQTLLNKLRSYCKTFSSADEI